MRGLLAIVFVLVAGIAAFLWFGGGGEVPAPPGGIDVSDDGNPGGGKPSGPAVDVERIRKLPDGVVATRAAPEQIEAEGLADEPTACLRVIDHMSEKPIAGAFVRSLHNGADLAFTDERGLASLPLKEAAQMAVVFDGYLLRLAPVQLGSNEREPQTVRLVPDRWSLRRRFAFRGPDGKAVDEVFVRLRPDGKPEPARIPVPRGDAVLQRAWSEHEMLAPRAVSRDVVVQLGTYDADRVHQLTGTTPMIRFAMAGDYILEAAATNGLVARATVAVIPGSEPPAQVVEMTAGASIEGRVTDLAGTALEGATITIQGGEPLGLRAATRSDGSFTIGPLAIGSKKLLVRHGTHAPVAHGPVNAPGENVVVKLKPLARTPLRGRVRARPGLAPIAGATVIWQVAGGAAISAKTGADGTFELQAAGDVASKLIVQAPGYVRYSELVEPSAAFADYDVWSAVRATRVQDGTTATLEGVVIGANGYPLANASVRWRPDNKTGVAGVPGRRILEGAVLQLPGVATTDSSGAFVVETNQFGPGVVSLESDTSKHIAATAVAGQSSKGLTIKQ